ncbi:MAG: transglycosylase SLT domain-containing protein, partial [Chitinivibrionales bacterium]|nr:transglycosylase SLT domain-containing protein [Chitinivibrionales bacterium]MBD3357113.1 transglycosylase SLT domain-containing protein [Chitinivibrionales bacterium]
MRSFSLILFLTIGIAVGNSRHDGEERFLFGPYGIASCGADFLRAGRPEKAMRVLESQGDDHDTAFYNFKLGLAYAGVGEHSRALLCLRKAAEADAHLAPIAYEKIGDVEYAKGRFINALQVYRTAATDALNQRHQYYLYEKMYTIATEHKDSIGRLPWLEKLLSFPEDDKPSIGTDSLRAALKRDDWEAVDSITKWYLDTTTYRAGKCEACSVLSSSKALPDTLFTTAELYRVMLETMECAQYSSSSDWLHRALKRDDFKKTVPTADFYRDRAQLNYYLGNYGKAIRWFTKYEKRFGPTPRLVYLVAKSYRAQGNGARASAWYDKHTSLYPYHSKTHDILWYRAWQKEDAKDWEGARKLYRKIYTVHRRRSKADDSYFRYALTYYREGEYKSAEKSFSSFVERYPASRLASGARYWIARCLYARDLKERARAAFHEVIEYDPLDYYAFRAERMLAMLEDTVKRVIVDTTFELERTLAWLDSVSETTKRDLAPEDSAACALGRKLTYVGLARHASFLLEPIEISYPGNLRLQFELSVLYRMCADPGLSYRVGRRLAWRIPSEHRKALPAPIFSILYPFAHAETVEKVAALNNISPAMIWAIMRQESIFDHKIVSPVGAIGLMQIMPYTGEEIARDLGESFVLDSLYHPATNVRYGGYYIKKLLDSFDGETFKALAGYNGGPHNVRRWFPRRDERCFDLLVEDVGYSETRNYVKKVLANYWTYQRLITLAETGEYSLDKDDSPSVPVVVPPATDTLSRASG